MIDEDNKSFITPENKLSGKELAEFVKKIYAENKVNKNKDTTQPRSTSHDANEKNNQPSPMKNEEALLREELKQICDESGKEIKPRESALIFHKLAQIYRKRSPDKLSLIKSAALYNAALIRSPVKKEIEENLHRLSHHILEQAGAKISDADLVEKANEIKKKFENMRKSVNEKLNSMTHTAGCNGEKISVEDQETQRTRTIKLIQNEIFSSYSVFMDEISGYCNYVMGEPPCKFSVVGMGSLSRKEISPFSDFEHMILLEDIQDEDPIYKSKLEYFRWFSTIFHVIVINLQETILPSVDIVCLRNTSSNPGNGYWFYDNVASRGISFDGLLPWANKNPLGRQEFTEKKQFKTELIKPVSKMLQYLSSKEDLKQGYHLADLLTKVCFVHGDKNLFEIFENKMYQLLETNTDEDIVGKLEKQLNEDFQNFAVRSIMLQLRSNKPINIKKVVYRSTTLFISALGRIHKIRKNSCFDIIEKLFEKNLISENSKHKLDYAIALACEARLRWYMQRGRQEDIIESQSDQRSTIELFTSLLGLENTISYFQIAYSLQCDVSKRFSLKKMHFYSDPQLLNHKIIFGLNCEDQTLMTITSQKNNAYNERFLDFDECLSQLEQNIEIKKEEKEKKIFFDKKLKVAENYMKIADKCRNQCRWDDAMEFHKMSICIIKELGYAEHLTQHNKMHRHCLFESGYCLFRSYKYKDAINKYKEAMLVCENLPQDNDCYMWVAKCLRWIGINFVVQLKKTEAKKYFEQSLLIFQSTSINIDCDEDISDVLENLMACYIGMNQNEAEQKYYYERLKHIQKQKSSNNELQSDDGWGGVLNNGASLYILKKYDEALESFKKSLEIRSRISIDKLKDNDIAFSLHWIGLCLYELNEYDEALESFKKSLEIRDRASIDKPKDSNIAESLYWIGLCLYGLNKYDKALERFKECLYIRERDSTDIRADQNIALTLDKIVDCLVQMNENNEAEIYQKRAEQIKANI